MQKPISPSGVGMLPCYRLVEKNIANNLDVIFNRHKKPISDTMGPYRGKEDHLPFDIRGGGSLSARSAIEA